MTNRTGSDKQEEPMLSYENIQMQDALFPITGIIFGIILSSKMERKTVFFL